MISVSGPQTTDGVAPLDAPPTLGNNVQRAVDEIASANGVSNKINDLIYPRRPRRPRRRTGVLAAADVFTESTAFWVMESIRLDLGYGSQVHP
jgi:hypothetical protein